MPQPSPKGACGMTLQDHINLSSLGSPFAPQPKVHGIHFARNNGNTIRFSEPGLLHWALLPSAPGIYAILVRDQSCKPRAFRALYFGEADDLHDRVNDGHEKYLKWVRAAGGKRLFVAFRVLSLHSEAGRKAVEKGLIEHYAPECNIVHNTWLRAAMNTRTSHNVPVSSLLCATSRRHVAPSASRRDVWAAAIARAKRNRLL
jgi:hypothetical protein